MPTSIDPQPKENEIECARCGSYFYYELTRCPGCGVNVYGAEEEIEDYGKSDDQVSIIVIVKRFFRRLFGKPYLAKEVFGDALDQAVLYNELLGKVGGDHQVVERLIEFEQQQKPDRNRIVWLENALQRWERDNRTQRHK
jgi:hypothetical protein